MGCREAQNTARHHYTQRQEGILRHMESERRKTDSISRYVNCHCSCCEVSELASQKRWRSDHKRISDSDWYCGF